ncbi:MAG: hypothetical protein DRP30_04115 [Thermotoga sp.]|nr:MAG: hypothetical protein DRP30_04115 [Thermotoga sp.]HDM70943.1 hypothetical protein [Thermotogales bacterium]
MFSKVILGVVLIFLGIWLSFYELIPGGFKWIWGAAFLSFGISEAIVGYIMKSSIRIWGGSVAASMGYFVMMNYILGLKPWPAFLVGFGVAFILQGLMRNNGKELSSGILFTGIGIVFVFCKIFGWWLMKFLWPTFILSPGIGLLIQRIYSGREYKQSLFYLLSISGLLYIVVLGTEYPIMWGIGLIFLGIYVLIRQKKVTP